MKRYWDCYPQTQQSTSIKRKHCYKVLPIPTHIRFANFKTLLEDTEGKKLFKLGNYVSVRFIGVMAGININVAGAFCPFTRNTRLDL